MYSGIDSNPEAIKALLKKFGFRLYEVIGAKEITARFHPHVTKWNPMVGLCRHGLQCDL